MNRKEREALYEAERVRARALAEQQEHERQVARMFDEAPRVRNTDPETSHGGAGNQEAIVMIALGIHYLHAETGLIDEEIATFAGHPGHESYRRRGSQLRDRGWTMWVYEDTSGEVGVVKPRPLKRKSRLGRNARVSRITQHGRRAWEAYRDAQG